MIPQPDIKPDMTSIATLKKKWMEDPKVSEAFEAMKPEMVNTTLVLDFMRVALVRITELEKANAQLEDELGEAKMETWWRSVDELLPEEKDQVIVRTNDERHYVATLCKETDWLDEKPKWLACGRKFTNVTHWMPVPEMPHP